MPGPITDLQLATPFGCNQFTYFNVNYPNSFIKKLFIEIILLWDAK